MVKRRLSPGKFIVIGFVAVMLVGALLLMLPISIKQGASISLIDALFTSTSAVCVTGLISVDSNIFTLFGQIVLMLLIQIGGLGVTSIGVGFIIFTGKKIGLHERKLAQAGMNYSSMRGVLGMVKAVLITTLCFELVGAVLSFISFSKVLPLGRAIWVSIFHSVAAFNNSGFDVLGGFNSLIPYSNDVLLNITTCFLIIFGGLGFFVIRELLSFRKIKRFTFHTKVVLMMSAVLLAVGTILLMFTDKLSFMSAFFQSTSARTAGFSTVNMGALSGTGLFIMIVLMFIGASPGSTGGGIKTTTYFVLLMSGFASATGKNCSAFKRTIPQKTVRTAFLIFFIAILVVVLATLALGFAEPSLALEKVLFEVVSAFGTVGLSTGITPGICALGKTVLIITMFVGRLGPLTVASLMYIGKPPEISYAEEDITVG